MSYTMSFVTKIKYHARIKKERLGRDENILPQARELKPLRRRIIL
jgi:hypothetical protein